MRDRVSIAAAAGSVLGVFGLCCALPVLLSAGVAGSIAGISLGSWALIVLGGATLALGLWLRRQRRVRKVPRRSPVPPDYPAAKGQ